MSEAEQPESLWVCVKDGGRREVSDAECERCARWEAAQEGAPLAAPVFLSPRWRA